MSGLIAIVGRPNVGKSALFNRIAGRRIAIVHDQPGVTRDRVTAEIECLGRSFTLVDTGGLGLLRGEKAPDAIIRAAMQQAELAIDAADVILLVVNVQEGVVPLDREVADRLRRSGKPVLVVVNKVDNPKAEAGLDEFAELGFTRMFPVTAIHGVGLDALMETAMGLLDKAARGSDAATTPGSEGTPATEDQPKPVKGEELKIAIIGRPNVGKSSLINALTQSERVVVSPIPGTTRDSVDVPFVVEGEGGQHHYVLIDTAGLRKARRIADSIEFFSVKRTEDSVARCDLAVLVLDADAGITVQDKKVADLITKHTRSCVVVVNKWDLVSEAVRQEREEEIERRRRQERRQGPKSMTTLAEFGQWVQEHLFFLDYAPVIFTSAQSGFHLDRLLEAIGYVAGQLQQKIPTGILNRALHDAVERRQPVSSRGHRLKFYYATQVKQAPPTFILFVNRADLFAPAYRKYLEQQVRAAFGYEGCPIVLLPRERPKTIEPVRRFKGKGGKGSKGGKGGKGGKRRPGGVVHRRVVRKWG